MRLSEGVEWAAHACAVLAALPRDRTLPGAKLAEYLEVPSAYLAKHLQALSRAGILETARGPAGGYRLAKSIDKITLADIATAIEGREPAFRCQEIRQRGPIGSSRESCRKPCGIAASFYRAERAWRAELAKVTLVDVLKDAAASFDAGRAQRLSAWISENAR